MSVVTIQLGQCGNQTGCQLFSTIMEDINQPSSHHCPSAANKAYCSTSLERFFTERDLPEGDAGSSSSKGPRYRARAVMVDMEAKVIAQTSSEAKKSGSWEYAPGQQFCQKRGSGNNWAHGYCSHAPKAQEEIMNKVRKEVEKCDLFGGFLGLMSLAGGTGSGVGAYVTQCLRDEYPHSFIMNKVVWPYDMGEVIVQNYNAVLTLSHLYQNSDAILAMHNDSLQRICSQLLNIRKVSFQDINKVIGHKLASVLQPCYTGGERLVNTHLGNMLEHLVSHPEYKLLTIRNIPQMSKTSKAYSSYQWPGLLKHLRQMLISNSPMEEGIDWGVKASPALPFNKSLANLLVLRGMTLPSPSELAPFSDPALFTSWLPPSLASATWTHPHQFCGYERCATLVSNSQALVEPMDTMVGKAWSMFASRAYVHQYLKHGLTEEDFVDSFACLEQVLASYSNL